MGKYMGALIHGGKAYAKLTFWVSNNCDTKYGDTKIPKLKQIKK